MIRSYKKMLGTCIQALDGDIGKLKDIYFDDSSWDVQYFVVELGSWFSGKEVIVPPAVITPFDGVLVRVSLTKAELKLCPHADTAIPVSLQQRYHERSLFNLVYNTGGLMYGGPLIVPPVSAEMQNTSGIDPHLRSCKKLSKYALAGKDGDIGVIADILFDDSTWMIRFIVASINDGSSRQEKLFNPSLVDSIEWSISAVKVETNRKQALQKPTYNPCRHLDTSYEVLEKEIC